MPDTTLTDEIRNRGVRRTILSKGTPTSVTGTTTETTLASVTIPGGTIGPNGLVEVLLGATMTSNTNAKSVRVRLGGTEVQLVVIATAVAGFRGSFGITNAGAQNAQFALTGGASGYGVYAAGVNRMAVDTSVDQSLTITVSLASAADTFALESAHVSVTFGA